MDSDSLFRRASALCRETWPTTIFSSFHLLERIFQYSAEDWSQMVSMSASQLNTNAEIKGRILRKIENASEEELQTLWANRHGVCTSWAVLLASKIAEDPNDLSFADAGYHRLAFTRCGILIDSSARDALQLSEDVPETHRNITYTMKGIGLDTTILSYTQGSKLHTTTVCANWQDAIRSCLRQAIRSQDILCMFRRVVHGELRFDGQIKWRRGKNTIKWGEHNVDPTTGRVIESSKKAVFGSGNLGTDEQCRKGLIEFATQGYRADQFKMVIEIIRDSLWPALVAKFGWPTLEEEEVV